MSRGSATVLVAVFLGVLAIAASAKAASQTTTTRIICGVFGPRYCSQALRVARCESGLSVYAHNGQYLGLFQMGSTARRLFGHGSSALEQAKAAHKYFVASGHGWGPWSCKPY